MTIECTKFTAFNTMLVTYVARDLISYNLNLDIKSYNWPTFFKQKSFLKFMLQKKIILHDIMYIIFAYPIHFS